jgi:hypothetical protein
MQVIINGLIGAVATVYGTSRGTTPDFALGTRAFGYPGVVNTSDADLPNCHGEFVYVKSGAAAEVGVCVILDKNLVTAVVPDTANTGQPVAICATRFTAADEYGWVQVSGQCPIKTSEAVDAGDPIYISGAGTLADTAAAGKQILGMLNLIGSAGAFTKAGCTTVNGGTTLKVPNTDGLYAGLTVSGTGIAASSEITDIDVGGNQVTISEAMTANGVITATFTHTGYGIAQIGFPHVQGQDAT